MTKAYSSIQIVRAYYDEHRSLAIEFRDLAQQIKAEGYMGDYVMELHVLEAEIVQVQSLFNMWVKIEALIRTKQIQN